MSATPAVTVTAWSETVVDSPGIARGSAVGSAGLRREGALFCSPEKVTYHAAARGAPAEMSMPQEIWEVSGADDESRANLEKWNFKLRLRIRQLEQHNRQLTRALVDVGDTNDQLRRIVEGASIGFCTLDALGHITELNLEASQLLGLAQRKCIGQRFMEFVCEHDRGKFDNRSMLSAGADSELRRGIEARLVPSGRVARVRMAPLGERGATIQAGCVLSLEDLTELRRALDEQARFQQLAATADDVYYETDEDDRAVHIGSAYERVWGRPVASGLGQPWLSAVHTEDRERVDEARQRLSLGQAFDEEYRILRPDGSVRWIRDRAVSASEAGSPVAGVARDVTEDKELEEELRQAQKLEALGILASRVAHDFGNLLQGVMGCLNIALSNATSPERSRDYTRQALAAVRGGSSLVQQLMKFGRKEEARPRAVCVDDTIAECAKLLEMLLGDGIGLELHTAAPGTLVVADPVQIEQILMNLAANARDAMPSGGQLMIRTKEVRDVDEQGQKRCMLRLEVRDVGCGMDAETRARVFEPFFTTKSAGKGTGLGLSTVRAVTRALGGRITIDSEVGQGTRFVFHFPVAERRREGLALPPPELGPPKSLGRALVVDDDVQVRRTLREALESFGFEVAEAGDGAQALVRSADDLRLLVADIVLPDVYGTKVRDQLRRRHPNLRTLFISAHPAPYLIQRGLLTEADLVLKKPFAIDDLATGLAKLSFGDAIDRDSAALFRLDSEMYQTTS
jgi:PAS domain S-box-containing protein